MNLSTPNNRDSVHRKGDGDGKEESAEAPPAGDEEMSTEAVAMAYLLRGVHF